jgi:hypothetical protein
MGGIILLLVTEVAARNLKNGTEWETIACVLSKAFSTDDKSVEVTGLACRERLERLIAKYKEIG